MRRLRPRSSTAKPVATFDVTFEVWPAPRPAGDGVEGVRLTPEGDLVEATEVYGRMHFGKAPSGVPAVGIGEPLTLAAQERYLRRLITDVFYGSRPDGERTQ